MKDQTRKAILDLLTDVEVADFAADLDLPHVFVIVDRQTGNVNVSGPYADLAAAAAHMERVTNELSDEPGFEFYVAPLTPPNPPRGATA